jgi:hypothetical protein
MHRKDTGMSGTLGSYSFILAQFEAYYSRYYTTRQRKCTEVTIPIFCQKQEMKTKVLDHRMGDMKWPSPAGHLITATMTTPRDIDGPNSSSRLVAKELVSWEART